MFCLTITGSKEFIDKIVKSWEAIKPYLENLEIKEAYIGEGGPLKVNAYLDTEEKIFIICDNPTLENIKSLIILLKAQMQVRKMYKELIRAIILTHVKQVDTLARANKKIKDFIREVYGEYTIRFLHNLILSLERTLSLEELSEEEKSYLKKVENIIDPFKEEVKNLLKLELYLAIVDNLWRKTLGWKPPEFALNVGVDINGLEEMFNTVFNVIRTQNYFSIERAAYAITEFTFRIFGIDISKMLPTEPREKEDNLTYIR